MKKIFTLICTLMGVASVANAADVEDLAVCKHSYVLVCDEYTNNGTGKRDKGTLFGDNFFLDVKGGSVSNSKKKSDPAEKVTDAEGVESYRYGEDFAKKYGEYGAHLNSLRLKNDQDMIAVKITAGSKLIFLLEGNNKTGKDARYPKISKNADLSNPLNAAPDASFTETTSAGFKYEWSCDEDMTAYIGSYNGDMFLAYVIVEANEAPGTPSVKVGPQTYKDGLWFREVTCKTNEADVVGDGSMMLPTICTYTTDGTEPTKESPIYTEPIKCYKDQTVKFQAFFDEDGKPGEVCENADNEGIATFSFNAPAITVAGPKATIVSEYEGAKNFVSYLDQKDVEANEVTLEESAALTAYSQITNGEYTTFTTKSASKDVYVLNPIKEKKTIAVVAGKAVLDEEATATSTTGPVYTIEDGKINTDKMDFYVKNLTYGALPNSDKNLAKFQAPTGKEGYIKMSNTNISFCVAAGDSVNVIVTCTKNSCKNLDIAPLAEGATDKDSTNYYAALMCMVNVNGTNYGDTIFVGDKDDLDSYRNVIEFGLRAPEDADKVFTFQKYSGTGNIMISSIVIKPSDSKESDEAEYVVETADPVPAGKSLAATCEAVKKDPWDSQIFIEFSKPLQAGKKYTVRMNVKGSEALEGQMGQYGWEAIQPIAQDANSENKDQWGGPADLQYMAHFSVATDWTVAKDHDGNGIMTDGNFPYSRLCLNLGAYKGTLYIDNFQILDEKGLVVEENTFETEAEQALVSTNYTAVPIEFVDPEAASISNIKATSASNAIFNLAGQKVNAAKGLVICDGKVILVK